MSDPRQVTLSWHGKGLPATRSGRAPSSGPRLAKALPLHRFEAPSCEGAFLFGSNLHGLQALKETHREKVTLAYLDPPFLTNRVHEVVDAGDRSAPRSERGRRAAFDDRWSDRASYLEALGERLVHARELLAPHGSIVVHVDPKTSHYVKVLCDEIFGEEAFASEIIWRYRRWPSKTPNFQRVHDVLLRYRKDPEAAPRWNTPYEPLAPSTRAVWGAKKQRAVFTDAGHRARSSTSEEESLGVPMGDVWDIGVLAPMSKERTGYPSQKPEVLLSRIISALTDPGDIVLDPYAGSGTTLAVAARLGRPFLGIDESPVSLEIASARLAKLGHPLQKIEPSGGGASKKSA